jgi:hypothetical protein
VNAGDLRFTDTDVAAVALARHFAAEACACTAALRRRYGGPPADAGA